MDPGSRSRAKAGGTSLDDAIFLSGGVISVAREYLGRSSEDEVRAEVNRIPARLNEIFSEADTTGRPTNVIADELARRIVGRAGDAITTADRKIA